MNLAANRLTGSIPSELGNLSNLKDFRLGHNRLTGSIPSELGNLVNLQWLDLGRNRLIGSIPSELGGLANLETMSLAVNSLTGSIRSELGNLAKLRMLLLGDNRLTGSIPAEPGNLGLNTLDLSTNQLAGALPPELGDVGNLRVLSLDFKQLTGPIPLSFANLVALDWFRFYMNPGLCAGADAVVQNWLDGIEHGVGPDCSPSITLSVTSSNLVEGRATAVTVTASQAAVSDRTDVNLLIGGTARLGESQDYRFSGFYGTFEAIGNALTIPANRASGTTVRTIIPRADDLVEGTENIILQAFVVESTVVGRPAIYGSRIEGSAVLP